MSRPLRWLYSALTLLVLVVGAPWWLFRMLTSGRYRAGLGERLGWTPAAVRDLRPGGQLIWVHAVSVGEVLAAVGLVRALLAALPGWTVAVSTTTATGQALARTRLGSGAGPATGGGLGPEGGLRSGGGLDCPVFYLPLDFAVLMRRVLRRLRPRLVVLMESELWPNMLGECARAGVSVAVANARVSDRSFPRYMRLRRLWRPLFGPVTRFLAQGEETAERLRAIGARAEQVVVTGNLKFDLPEPVAGPVTEAVSRWVGKGGARGGPLLVAGSTLEGEEEMVIAAWRDVLDGAPGARLVLAPRHPDRFGRVERLIGERGFGCVKASELVAGGAGDRRNRDILLLDTVGDLAAVYGLATAAFVGGSLVGAGGHNPLEPARFGVPVLVGASMENFREVVATMRAADGLLTVTKATLTGEVLRLFHDPEVARALGQRGQSVFRTETGATERTVRELLGLPRWEGR